MAKLTSKQKTFCDEYLIVLNATQAYLRARYSVKNKVTAEQHGSKLLKNTKVQEYIQKRIEITQDRVLKELARREFFFYCNLKAPDFYKTDRKYLVELCNDHYFQAKI